MTAAAAPESLTEHRGVPPMRLAKLAPTAARTAARRRGATLVEFAMVMPLFLLFLFSIFEYGRYLMMHQILHNAARDAARWGVVRGSSPLGAVFTTDTGPRLASEAPVDPTRPMYNVPFIQARLLTQTAGVERNLDNMSVRVYVVDTASLYNDPPVILPKQNTTAWNAGGFSDRLAVQVVGQYVSFLPVFGLARSTDISVTAMMGIEG